MKLTLSTHFKSANGIQKWENCEWRSWHWSVPENIRKWKPLTHYQVLKLTSSFSKKRAWKQIHYCC